MVHGIDDHGIDGYFLERARCSRRVALLTAVLAAAGGALLLAARTPPLQRLLTETARFGYEGPTQYVERITVKPPRIASNELRDIGDVLPVRSRGGDPTPGGEANARARPRVRPRIAGPGDGEQDLLARAVARAADIPVIQSEELVIDHLVRPEYPQVLRERNIEGRVSLQALIDTVGRVVEVEVLSSTGERLFEEAAETAVMQCRFRPYRRAGIVREVYAVFRFAFRIY